jgi:hypothetical protein
MSVRRVENEGAARRMWRTNASHNHARNQCHEGTRAMRARFGLKAMSQGHPERHV